MLNNHKYRFLLVDPPSVHHGPPSTISTQDKTLSSVYSKIINGRVEEYLSSIGTECSTAVNAKYISNYGLLMIGYILRQRGHSVTYENGDYYSGLDEFTDHILQKVDLFDCVCFTGTTPQYESALRIARALRLHSSIKMVIGGPHISFNCDVQNNLPFTAFIKGYHVEQTVDHLEAICCLEVSDEIMVLETTGYVDSPKEFSLIPADKLPSTLLYSYTSFGCPNRCCYCVERKLTSRLCFGDYSSKLAEIRYLVEECNIRFVHLADSDFFIHPHHARNFMDELDHASIRACYSVNTNPRTLLDPEVVELVSRFAKRGLVELLIGVEYFSGKVLSLMKKEYDIDRFCEAMAAIRRRCPDLIISFYSLVGLPGETPDTQRENLAWFQRFFDGGLVDFSFPKFFVPYPGTDVYENATSFGVQIIHHRWEEYHRWALPRPLSIDGMSEDQFINELENLYRIGGAFIDSNKN